MEPLPPRDQRHAWLRYEGQEYTNEIIHNFEERLGRIFDRQVSRVQVLNFEEFTKEMGQAMTDRLRMEHIDAQGISDTVLELDVADTLCFQLGGLRCQMSWRQFILALGLHMAKEMATDGFGAYRTDSLREIASKADLHDYWSRIAFDGDFLDAFLSYTSIRDPLRRLCHRLITLNISWRGQTPEMYLFWHVDGRKQGARMYGVHFVLRLVKHIGLITEESLRGLIVVAAAKAAQADQEIPNEGIQADYAPVQETQVPLASLAHRTMP
ncbi:hypothetical protein Tco_0971966 [Tanacetum coccineum]